MNSLIFLFLSWFITGAKSNENINETESLRVLDKYIPHLDQFGDRVSLRAYAGKYT